MRFSFNHGFFSIIMCCTFFNVPQGAPQLYVDLNASTSVLDSLYAPQKDSTFTAGIYISGVDNLYSYEFYIQFDTTRLMYVSSSKEIATAPHFMELHGESVTFQSNKSRNSNNKILVGGFYLSDIPGANGSGYLGVVSFCRLTSDSTTISLLNPTFLAPANDITISKLHDGLLLPPGAISVNKRKYHQANNKIQVINGTIHCTLPMKSSSQIRLLDIAGRCLFEKMDFSQQISIDLPRSGSGVYFLTIANKNESLVYPVIAK